MIKVTVRKDKNGGYKALECRGHAFYSAYGTDVVCAAVSMLVINSLNSIETLTDNHFYGEDDAKSGKLIAEFPEGLDEKGSLLMDSLVLGVSAVEAQYGKRYVRFTEVTE